MASGQVMFFDMANSPFEHSLPTLRGHTYARLDSRASRAGQRDQQSSPSAPRRAKDPLSPDGLDVFQDCDDPIVWEMADGGSVVPLDAGSEFRDWGQDCELR